jgi:hypothetical protein
MQQVKSIVSAFVAVLVVGGTAILAAPGQTQQPGQMTQARVWIQNRGRSEAVPVELREVNLETPIRVQVINGEPAYATSGPVQVREIRRVWDYETITIAPTENMAARLNQRGASGWETTGIVFASADGTTVLLKRPR